MHQAVKAEAGGCERLSYEDLSYKKLSKFHEIKNMISVPLLSFICFCTGWSSG